MAEALEMIKIEGNITRIRAKYIHRDSALIPNHNGMLIFFKSSSHAYTNRSSVKIPGFETRDVSYILHYNFE